MKVIIEIKCYYSEEKIILENAIEESDVNINIGGKYVTMSIEELKHALRKISCK